MIATLRSLRCLLLLLPCLTQPSPAQAEASPASQVAVLGYHRFEDPARDSLAITPAQFRAQMQAIQDAGVAVISMADFLAWRRGEKAIPERAVVITIDDGYNCTYHQAWPILRDEFGYPFTAFVYTNYISVGGRSITWEQLAEMRDGGVDIGSHSVAHDNMVRPRRAKGANYEEWLWNELKGSKDQIEEKLGIPVKTFAYPYGVKNQHVMQKGLDAGYEALFTVSGKKAAIADHPAEIGRYIVQSDKPETFNAALRFGSPGTPGGAAPGDPGGPAFTVAPAHRETISNPQPGIQADLSGFGAIDPKSIELRISGIGPVRPDFDPASGLLAYRPTGRLHHRENRASLQFRADGRRIDTSWVFFYDPDAFSPSETALEPPPEDAP